MQIQMPSSVAAGPGSPLPDAFGALLQALDRTIEEVKARSPEYFEQHALRTSLCLAGPDGDAGAVAEIVGDAYGIELVLGAEPSSFSTVDRLFESRIGPARESLPEIVGTGELEACVAAWARHHADSHASERARLAGFPGPETLRALPGGLRYHVFGDEGPVIVVVNAIAMGLRYWARLVDRLARDHRVVIWELRTVLGTGQVAALDDHAADLAAIVEEAADGPVHLVGWCSGPKVCLRYAAAHPERVASMVFLAGTYGTPSTETGYQKRLGKVFELLERSPGMTSTVRGMLTDSAAVAAGLSDQEGGELARETEVLARADPSLHESLVAPYASDESTLAYAKQIREFWSCPLDMAAASPTLVVGAELDRIASPKLGLDVASALPRGRFVEMPGATHYCMHDRPDEIAELIRDFVAARRNGT